MFLFRGRQIIERTLVYLFINLFNFRSIKNKISITVKEIENKTGIVKIILRNEIERWPQSAS